MKILRIATVCIAVVGCLSSAIAQDTPAPAATQTEMKKWIATTDAQWQATFNRDVTDVHADEIKKLALQYTAALEAAITKASGAGDLDGSIALRNEQKRYADTNVFPEQDETADAAVVKQVRATIRTQLGRIEKDNAVRTNALYAKYDQVLAQAQTQLTQHKRLDDAVLVKNKREEVAAAWLIGVTPVPAASPLAPPPFEQKPTPCERVSKFMADNMGTILGPLTAKVQMSGFAKSQLKRMPHPKVDLPLAEMLRLYTELNTEAAAAGPKDKSRYQAALAVCMAINNAIKEHQTSAANLDRSLQVPPTTDLSAKSTTNKFGSKMTRSDAADAKQAILDKESEIISRHNARWAELCVKLMQGITNLQTNALKLEKDAAVASQAAQVK